MLMRTGLYETLNTPCNPKGNGKCSNQCALMRDHNACDGAPTSLFLQCGRFFSVQIARVCVRASDAGCAQNVVSVNLNYTSAGFSLK
jgi:hypothetical protein